MVEDKDSLLILEFFLSNTKLMVRIFLNTKLIIRFTLLRMRLLFGLNWKS